MSRGAHARTKDGGRSFLRGVALASMALAVAWLGACSGSSSGAAADADGGAAATCSVRRDYLNVCGRVRDGGGAFRCNAKVRVAPDGTTLESSAPQGYGPPELRSAYALPRAGGAGRVVAIVDAYDDPTAESDLAVYRATFGLPPCTSATGCFRKVNEHGQPAPLPAADPAWASEISLDLDMVSAACPGCALLLVEASSSSTGDLGPSVAAAAALGASAISNSYSSAENGTVPVLSDEYYDHPGVLVVASAGDSGYGAEFPATSPYVLGVGGTTLIPETFARGWAESVWSGTGSGCSAFFAKPSWQNVDDGCSMRTVADLSAVADPDTGVAVYQTTGAGGWRVYGGTSVSAPLVAGIFTLLGLDGAGPSFPYSNPSDFYDVVTGANGSCGNSLCDAARGYDGPTGWGTPNGGAMASAFPSPGWGSPASVAPVEDDHVTARRPTAFAADVAGDAGASLACSHDLCVTGEPLQSVGDACAGTVCATDPYCCDSQWDAICVGEATKLCDGAPCSVSSAPEACTHSICLPGASLSTACGACASSVCHADPYCCQTLWDATCVGEASTTCGAGACP